MKFLPALILAIFSSLIVISCSPRNASQSSTESSSYASTLEKAKKHKRNLMMQSGINVYKIVSIEIERSRQEMTVQLNRLDSANAANFKSQGNFGSGNENSASIINGLVIYMKDSTSYTLDEPHTIPLNKVSRIQK